MANFLEQLVAEWYEFKGYFVRRNANVGRRQTGGYESELDVVALNPKEWRLIHIKSSMECHSWSKREKRFGAKFKAGKKYIPGLFPGFKRLPKIEQMVVLVYGSQNNHSKLGGGRLVLIKDFMVEIRDRKSTR